MSNGVDHLVRSSFVEIPPDTAFTCVCGQRAVDMARSPLWLPPCDIVACYKKVFAANTLIHNENWEKADLGHEELKVFRTEGKRTFGSTFILRVFSYLLL